MAFNFDRDEKDDKNKKDDDSKQKKLPIINPLVRLPSWPSNYYRNSSEELLLINFLLQTFQLELVSFQNVY